jgi:hypothetical protein
MSLINNENEEDVLLTYLVSDKPVKLTSKQEERLKRYETCVDLIKQYGSRNKVVPVLMKRYQITRRQAYRDFAATQNLFGATYNHEREFWIDIVLGEIQKTKSLAIMKKDGRAAAMADKNMLYTIERLMGDKEKLPFEEIQPAQILMGFFPENVNVEKMSEEDIEAAFKRLSKPKRKKDLNVVDVEPING